MSLTPKTLLGFILAFTYMHWSGRVLLTFISVAALRDSGWILGEISQGPPFGLGSVANSSGWRYIQEFAGWIALVEDAMHPPYVY